VRSLRARLTAGVLVVLTGLLVIAGVLAFHQVDRSERSGFDDRLRRTAELSRATASAAINDHVPADDRRLDAVLTATNSTLLLRLGSSVLLNTGAPPPPRPRPRLHLGLQTFHSLGTDYRAYVTTLNDPNLGGLARLEIVSSMKPLESRESSLHRQLALIALAALAVASLLVWLVASLALRPLERLRGTAASIAVDEDLTRRVGADGPTELRSLGASFNAMLARLGRSAADRERALEATRRFAADAGHELRTPLTSVQATLSALGRHPDLEPERREAMLADALAEQRRLVALLDGLQALARGDAGPLEHTQVDLAEVVDQVVSAQDAPIDARLPDRAVVVEGWEPGLRMLVANLVGNAVGHGREDGRVRVTLTPDAVLQVDDDGPGVPPAERERIFEPFARLNGTDRPGSGLGLALVAQQARHHGAAVEVGESDLGGARFTVRFVG